MRHPLKRKAGQSLVELSLMLVFIAILLIGILSLTGQQVSTVFTDVDSGLAGKPLVVKPGKAGSNAGGNATGNAGGNGNGNGNPGGNSPGNAGGNGNGRNP